MMTLHRMHRLYGWKQRSVIIVVTLVTVLTSHNLSAQDGQASIYLPLIASGPAPSIHPLRWQPNEQEQQLEELFLQDPEQHRRNPTRNDILAHVAHDRAQDMATRHYFSHTDPDGHQANFLVEQAGYQLPNYYPNDGNNIESIGLNYATGAEAWQAWKDSPAHRVHVLGEDPFFAEQIDFGMGYVENSNGKYWVLITARH